MKEFRRILIPADGSEHSDFAVATGLDLARLLHRPVHIVYVVDARSLEPYPNEGLFVDLRTVLDKEAHKVLSAVEARAKRAKVKATTAILNGIPEEEIVAAARPNDCIVIATHGRRGLSRLLLGSVAENVVRHAPCPVLVVRRPGKKGKK